MQFTWLKQQAPNPHGWVAGGQGFGVHVDEATGVHPVGHAGPVSGWQLPVAGSQHTDDGPPHGFVGVQVVPAG